VPVLTEQLDGGQRYILVREEPHLPG
jgi:hypothetical protein